MTEMTWDEIILTLNQLATEYNNTASAALNGENTDVASFCLKQGKVFGVEDAIDVIKKLRREQRQAVKAGLA